MKKVSLVKTDQPGLDSDKFGQLISGTCRRGLVWRDFMLGRVNCQA